MLTITVLGEEHYDEESKRFKTVGDFDLQLEHSLVSLSKWESIHEKPFLGREEKTTEETLAYVQCMILTPDVPPEVYARVTNHNLEQINAYIASSQTATWFNETPNAPKSSETITAELIYYWMTVFNIPFECENWHLNRLFTLIKICNLKNAKPKKMSRSEIQAHNRRLNAQRRKELGTSG